MKIAPTRRSHVFALASILFALLLSLAYATMAVAAPPTQEEEEPPTMPEEDAAECQSCHLDVAAHWEQSPHAHAYDDPVFQEQWAALGNPDDCLRCHTTGFEPSTGLFSAEGVDCETCHGSASAEHPPEPVPILAGPQQCGDCHTTTLGEWHGSGHAAAGVDCMGCHNPHNQQPLFADPDQMCLNCHEDTMGDYLEDLHYSEDIGCVDCHALVIPPETIPQDGIVPTGHGFTITPATCVACHTDSLHAGFSLPGYEHGAASVEEGGATEQVGFLPGESEEADAGDTAAGATVEQQVQVLEAALASRRITMLFQGGLVGLAFGGITAWFVASNMRAHREDEEGKYDERD